MFSNLYQLLFFYFVCFFFHLPVIPAEFIAEAEIRLLIAFRRHLPVRILVQVRKMGIGLLGIIDPGHMSRPAIGKELAVDLPAADDIDIVVWKLF